MKLEDMNLLAQPEPDQAVNLAYGVPAYDGRGAADVRRQWGHEAPKIEMNFMALQVEAMILALPEAWQWIPDTPIAHRGNTRPIVETSPEIDIGTSAILPEPRAGFRGVYPYGLHQSIPFPNPWE